MPECPICFVIGPPRSGSTWFLKLLNQHPEVFASENRFFGDFCEMWPDADGVKSVRITLDHFAKFQMKGIDFDANGMDRHSFEQKLIRMHLKGLVELSLKQSGKSVFVDKINPYPNTANCVFDSIQHYVPNARIIELLRDGRDVITSLVFNWIAKIDHGKDRYRKFVNREAVPMQTFFETADFERWLDYWIGPTRYFLEHETTVSLGLRYERLIDDASSELDRVFQLFGVTSDPALRAHMIEQSDFSRMSGGRQRGEDDPTSHARKGVVGDWKQYFTREDGKVFEQMTGGLLVKTGYEENCDWWKSLPPELEL